MKRNSKKYRSVIAGIMAAAVIFSTAVSYPAYASEQEEEMSTEVIIDELSETEQVETATEEDVTEIDATETGEDATEVEVTEADVIDMSTEMTTTEEAEIPTEVTEMDTEEIGETSEGENIKTSETGETAEVIETDLQTVNMQDDAETPIITGFSLQEDGQTVTSETVLHFIINTYNEECTIQSVRILASVENMDIVDWYSIKPFELSPGVWCAEFAVEKFHYGPGVHKFKNIIVTNSDGNRQEFTVDVPYTVNYDISTLKQYTGSFELASDKDIYGEQEEVILRAFYDEKLPTEQEDGQRIGFARATISKDGVTETMGIFPNNDGDQYSLVIDNGNWYLPNSIGEGTWKIEAIEADIIDFKHTVAYIKLTPATEITFNCKKQKNNEITDVNYNINFITYGENYGEYLYNDTRKRIAPSKAKLSEIVGELPTLPDYNGEQFVGWADDSGHMVDEDTEIVATGNISFLTFYPIYTKQTITCEKIYINTAGKVVVEYEKIKCAYNEKRSDILAQLSAPQAMQGTFSGWKNETDKDIDAPVFSQMHVVAVPDGKKMIYVNVNWLGQDLRANNHSYQDMKKWYGSMFVIIMMEASIMKMQKTHCQYILEA